MMKSHVESIEIQLQKYIDLVRNSQEGIQIQSGNIHIQKPPIVENLLRIWIENISVVGLLPTQKLLFYIKENQFLKFYTIDSLRFPLVHFRSQQIMLTPIVIKIWNNG